MILTYRPCCGPTFPLSNEELAVISSSLMVPSCIPNGAMHCAKQQGGSVITFGPCLRRVSYLHGSTAQLSRKSNIKRRCRVRARFFIMCYVSGHFICKEKQVYKYNKQWNAHTKVRISTNRKVCVVSVKLESAKFSRLNLKQNTRLKYERYPNI